MLLDWKKFGGFKTEKWKPNGRMKGETNTRSKKLREVQREAK